MIFFLPELGRNEINSFFDSVPYQIGYLYSYHFTNIYSNKMEEQQAEATANVPEAGGQQHSSGSKTVAPKTTVRFTDRSPIKKPNKNKKLPRPTSAPGALLAKLPENLADARRVIASADRLPCERCHQEQRPLPPEYMYLWCGRCKFQGTDVFMPYRRLRQDNHVFFAADYGTSVDITALKILDGKLVTGPPEGYSRPRGVSFNAVLESAKNTVRRKLLSVNNSHD